MNTIPTYAELQKMASVAAQEIIESKENDNHNLVISKKLRQFEAAYQTLLSDKVYTALYRTYSDWLLCEVKNHFSPGSSTPIKPIKPSSISDNEVIYRRNRLRLSNDMANDCLFDIELYIENAVTELVKTIQQGLPYDELISKHQLEATKIYMDYGLTEDESNAVSEKIKSHYNLVLSAAIEKLTNK